tara:strand:+ start:303 stop:425 length:123 start_codon:yes stop_codon:yes gene_type:complete
VLVAQVLTQHQLGHQYSLVEMAVTLLVVDVVETELIALVQ